MSGRCLLNSVQIWRLQVIAELGPYMVQATVTRSDIPAVTAIVDKCRVTTLVAAGTIQDIIVMWGTVRQVVQLGDGLRLNKLLRRVSTRRQALF
jgi:hypothetical protein